MGSRRINTISALTLFLTLMLNTPTIFCCWGNKGDEPQDELDDYTFDTAGIAADHKDCSKIGRNIMENLHGNAADAAIAAMLCVGVINAHSTGIGGGHMTVYYDRPQRQAIVINAREKAPLYATKTMFNGTKPEERDGVSYIAVPGELKGHYELFRNFGSGKVRWRQLFEPTINLARYGFQVGGALAKAIYNNQVYIRSDPGLREVFIKGNDDIYLEGDLISFPKLAETLEIVADRGNPEPFYTGELVADIVKEIRDAGGKLNSSDLANYNAPLNKSIQMNLNGLTMHTPNPPANGAVASFILKILEGTISTAIDKSLGFWFDPSSISDQETLTYHRIIEAFKFGCATGSRIGDIDFNSKEMKKIVDDLLSQSVAHSKKSMIHDDKVLDYEKYGDMKGCEIYDKGGTTHVSVIDGQGNAVAMTSSINYHFGAKFRGTHTGIIYNNHMSDFVNPDDDVTPPDNSGNFIEPGKRPMSAMVPTVIVHNTTGEVRMATGGAGAATITTSTALVIMHSLWFDKNVIKSIERDRLHYNGTKVNELSGSVIIEPDLFANIQKGLTSRGHNIAKETDGIAVMQLVTQDGGKIYAYSDERKPGAGADGY